MFEVFFGINDFQPFFLKTIKVCRSMFDVKWFEIQIVATNH
ncbi:MAG: hypothetical protein H6Q18_456 [Bacteroidetes bacterium]|nr:hypothetical protein [Bacteroidota bacterium]